MKNFIVDGTDQFQASASILAAASRQSIITVNAPPNQMMRVTAMATYARVLAAWGNLTWNFPVNGIDEPAYKNQLDQIGLENSPMALGKFIEVPAGGVFQVVISNGDGANAYVGGVIFKVEYGRKI